MWSQISFFWPFIALLGFLGFWAILGLDYIGFWFWEFFGQNFKICRNLALWLPTPTNLKFFIVESCLEGYAFTNINFSAIFRNFEYFGLLGYFGLRNPCKIKIAHILSSRDNSKIAAPPPPLNPKIVFKFLIMRAFLMQQNRAFLRIWRQSWFCRPPSHPCLTETWCARFYFCKDS